MNRYEGSDPFNSEMKLWDIDEHNGVVIKYYFDPKAQVFGWIATNKTDTWSHLVKNVTFDTVLSVVKAERKNKFLLSGIEHA